MNLREIMAIAGKPGLYKVVAQAKNGIIVESIIDHKRFQAFTHDKVSSLEEISIFTETDDMPLKEVLQQIYQKLEAKPAPDFKGDNAKIKNFFNEVLPGYDKERVYVSHMQKVINWYNLLLQHDMIDLKTDEETEAENAAVDTAGTGSGVADENSEVQKSKEIKRNEELKDEEEVNDEEMKNGTSASEKKLKKSKKDKEINEDSE